MAVLEIKDLNVSFTEFTKGFEEEELQVLSNLDLSCEKGEITAVVGASGSGKSILAHAIFGILPSNATVTGDIFFKGEPLTSNRQEAIRGKEMAIIPQSVNYLNPLMKVGRQIQLKKGNQKALDELFKQFNLSKNVEKMYPFELSGGMARRVLLATALLTSPDFIVADEPTPGLDERIVQEALLEFRKIADSGIAVIFITHDIESALKIADKVAVFNAGSVIEIADKEAFSGQGEKLSHPYSRALWNALPQNAFTPFPNGGLEDNELLEEGFFTEASVSLRDEKKRCLHAT